MYLYIDKAHTNVYSFTIIVSRISELLHVVSYTCKTVQGGAKNVAILSHCKYSENSMTELRGN